MPTTNLDLATKVDDHIREARHALRRLKSAILAEALKDDSQDLERLYGQIHALYGTIRTLADNSDDIVAALEDL